MTIEEILYRRPFNQVDTGFYCSLFINTKGMGLPEELLFFLRGLISDTGMLFNIKVIYEQTANISMWREYYPSLKNTDTLYQFICVLNVELSEKDFAYYMNLIVADTVQPFMREHGVEFMGDFFLYQTPHRYLELATGGEKAVVILSDEMTMTIRGVLMETFCLREDMILHAESMMTTIGQYNIPECLKAEKVDTLKELMESVGIKYEII